DLRIVRNRRVRQGSDLDHSAIEDVIGERVDPNVDFHSVLELIDVRLRCLDADLLGALEVDHAQDLLPLADLRAFLDLLRRIELTTAVSRGIGVNHDAVDGGGDGARGDLPLEFFPPALLELPPAAFG